MSFDFLSSEIYWTALEAIGTFLAVIVALSASIIGIKQANRQEKNAQQLQMDQDMPIVFLNPQPRLHKDGGVRLELMNVGKGIAKNVSVFLEGAMVDGNFSMHTFSPTNSSQLEIKVIDTGSIPDKKSAIANEIQRLSSKNELEMKITYYDIYGREFVTDQIIFEKNQVGDYMHNRGKWAFRKVEE